MRVSPSTARARVRDLARAQITSVNLSTSMKDLSFFFSRGLLSCSPLVLKSCRVPIIVHHKPRRHETANSNGGEQERWFHGRV